MVGVCCTWQASSPGCIIVLKFSAVLLKEALMKAVSAFSNICSSLGIKFLLKYDWTITLGAIDLLISQKLQKSKEKCDTILKILLTWVSWTEKCTKKLIL